MLNRTSPLEELITQLASGPITPEKVATGSLARANHNASHNSYLHLSPADVIEQAASLSHHFAAAPFRPPLYCIPISLKDCFDLVGTVTTCGTRFYAQHHAPAERDSAMAARLRDSGALITGKTHLHPLAYGITGQNPDFGDCLQPRDPTLLTGGSSSGAAASVQEGSALAAIGTDTGGSIRVPAALCGLAGYRASHALAYAPGPWPSTAEGLWNGAAHLAPSFDTPGFLVRDLRDLLPIANALFDVSLVQAPQNPLVGYAGPAFLEDCDADVLMAYSAWREVLTSSGALLAETDTTSWVGSQDIFAPIQAHEAAMLHRGHYDAFEPTIAQRLQWGASLTPADLDPLRNRLAAFRVSIAQVFTGCDLLMLPCAPVSRLLAAEDQTSTRARILRYTTPFSLAGLPAVTLPGELIGAAFGTGIQLAAAPGRDSSLLAYAASLTQALVDRRA